MGRSAGGHDFEHDVFVSYSHQDIGRVRTIVKSLERQNLKVWWDQGRGTRGIPPGSPAWDKVVVEAIGNSHKMLVVLTEAVNASGNVMVEMEIGKSQNKLLPIFIDKFELRVGYRAIIVWVQQLHLVGVTDWDSSPDFIALCRVCAGTSDSLSETAAADISPDAVDSGADPVWRAKQWLSGVVQSGTTDTVVDALAVAVLEGAPYTVVQNAAEPLREALQALVSPDKKQPLQLKRLLVGKSDIARQIDAEIFPQALANVKLSTDCIRFKDADRATALLSLVWEEMDEIRRPFIQWLNKLIEQDDSYIPINVAFAIGVLAQRSFVTIFNQMVADWALSDNPSVRKVADLTMSIAAAEPDVRDAISSELIESWASDNSSDSQFRAALELACGHTGFKMPRQAIAVLKKAARRPNVTILDQVVKVLHDLIILTQADTEVDLFSLPSFIMALVDWAEEADSEAVLPKLPAFLFLNAVASLDVGGGDVKGGLFGLLHPDGDVETTRTAPMVNAFARAFSFALGNSVTREPAKEILRAWAKTANETGVTPDPVLILARALLCWTEEGSRNRDRVTHLFRRWYTPDVLMSDIYQGKE